MSLGKRLFIGEAAAADAACSTDSVQPFGAESAYSSNVALYQLDSDGGTTNNVPDTVGNYNGTATGITYSTGQFGNAAVFNGSSSIIKDVLGSGFTYAGKTMTFSAWIFVEDASNDNMIIGDGLATSTGGWGISTGYGNAPNRSLAFSVASAAMGGVQQTYSSVSVSDNTWTHIVVSVDFSSITNSVKMYINGTEDTSITEGITGTTFVDNTTYNTAIGGTWTGSAGRLFEGKIDQVRIYDRGLNTDEVSILYNETTDTVSDTNVLDEGSGVALYSLDYDASDAGGNYDGTPSNVEFGVDGQINWGASFNGSSSKITIPSSATAPVNISTGTFSISMWVNMDNLTNNNKLVYKWGSTAANRNFLFTVLNSSGYLYFIEGTTGGDVLRTGTFALSTNTWHHITLTRQQSGSLKMYVDGDLKDTFAATGTFKTSTEPIYLGYQLGQSTNFTGSMDQVRMFTKELSSTEVSTLYGETACVYTPTTDTLDYQGTNIAYYKLDGNANDETSNYNAENEIDITYEFGRYGTAAVFNNSSSYITANNSMFGTGDGVANLWSISLWFKTDGSVTASRTLVGTKGGSTQSGFILFMISGGQIRYYEGDTSTNSQQLTTTASYDDGNWHNVVMTRSGTTDVFTMYIDGAEVIAPTTMTNPHTSHYFNLHIGRYPASIALFWDGSIDQVRIFGSALDATAVANLYNEKQAYITKNASDPFGDGSEDLFLELNNNVEDSSDQSNDCSSSCLFTTDSLFGSHSADIVTTTQDSRIVVPSDNDLYHSGGTFTISMWAKTDTAISTNYRTLWGMYERNPDLSGHGAFLIRLNSGKIKVENYNNAWFLNQSDFTPSVDRWYHYCFTVNGGTMEVFIDGSLHATHTGLNIDYTASTSPNPQLTLGGYNQAGGIRSYWDGKLDNIRFFDRALDGDEVFKLYAEVIN